MRIAAWVVLFAACGAGQRPRAATGAIAGVATDHDSGVPISKAEIRVRAQSGSGPVVTTSNWDGLYKLGHLPPGRYQLTAKFAGQPIEVTNIDVTAGDTKYVDVVFTLGRPDPQRVDYDDTSGRIDRYRPTHLGAAVAMIEGTVNDASTRDRVAGAVVTAINGGLTQQTVSDDRGRFRFDGIAPGTYSVSTYYNISGRGQIEVRRSLIDVAGAEAVVVPLWIEMGR